MDGGAEAEKEGSPGPGISPASECAPSPAPRADLGDHGTPELEGS